MKAQLIRFGMLLTALTLLVFGARILRAAEGGTRYEVEVRPDVKVPMRDGVLLSANVFLPKAEGRFPVLLQRSPYGKGDRHNGEGIACARRGCVFVSQDCRGRGGSGGVWEPFANERADGRDTQAWILKQPWCNGRLGTVGGSYVGYTQWIATPNADEDFKATFSYVPLIDCYGDAAYTGGAFNLSLLMGWGSIVSYPLDTKNPLAGWNASRWRTAFWTLPLCQWDRALDHRVQYLRDWIAHPCFDQYWAARGIRGRWQDVTVPNFVVGGWYDIFASSVFEHIGAVRAMSRSPVARAHQHLLVGPWTHGAGESSKVGDLDFGPLATAKAAHLAQMSNRWFEHWLNGKENDVESWPAYRIFVMGRNQWRDEAQWPPKRARYSSWYFHSQGRANTLSGDGRLSTASPGGEPRDTFVYDPADPVPTLGGCNLMGCPAGPRDQTPAEKRSDVLVFTSAPLPKDVEATGPVKVVLYAASSAVDTDWTAKLVDVDRQGRPYNLCDGILRARHRESPQTTSFLQPARTYRYEINVGVTSNVFLAGHRIRVEISSSNFPRFDRNLNTADAWGTATTPVKATQCIYHNRQSPSSLVLPVIP